MLRLAIDLTPTLQTQAGLGRYAAELAKALLATQPADERLELFYTDPQQRQPPAPLHTLPGKRLALASKPWRLRVLLAHLFQRPQDRMIDSPDVFLATDHLLPFLPQTSTIFTIHDVTFISHPHTHSRLNRSYLRLMMPYFLRRAKAVVAVSQCTLQNACQYYPIVATKGYVIYSGVDGHFQPVVDQAVLDLVRSRYKLPAHFWLYVGTIEPRKNLVTLFEAFKQALPQLEGDKLVIAGKKGWLYDEILARLKALGLEDHVLFTGYVPDAELPALYTLAQAFVFPSLYEGFGLPILEAMACGTPVICSNRSSLPEVAGEAALLLSPDNPRGWAEAMSQLKQNESLRADLRERGLRQVKGFTWETTAQHTRQLYREIYANRS
jgi:glycosyltransferase involved in cell wall biosynthesis